MERARRRAAGITSSAERERVLAAADDYQRPIDAATMVSVDQYRQELRWQMDRAVTYGATEILINGGELCRTLGRGYRRDANACSKAMRAELKRGDTVIIGADAGVGMTVQYRLPRASE